MADHVIHLHVVKARYPGWRKTHYVSISGAFTTRISDAARYESREEAARVALSFKNIWGKDYAFWAGRIGSNDEPSN